jgi:shikimate dehydrogenase
MIGSDTKVIALIGNPVKHSFSPGIHNYFIKKYLLDSVYLAFGIREENLKEAFTGAGRLGFLGLNVTMPFKEKVFGLVDRAEGAAKKIKSVNTVKFYNKKGISEGFNTDAAGFMRSLDDKNFKWPGSSCLVIGAGGAARGAVSGMLRKKVRKIWIYNRDAVRAKKIIKDMGDEGAGKIRVLEKIDGLKNEIDGIDLIVNCTPLGMDIKSYKKLIPVPETWNLDGKFVFDMVYNPVETLLLKKAKKEGAEAIDGIDLLVNQAAESFKIWFGIMPEEEYIEEIKKQYKII